MSSVSRWLSALKGLLFKEESEKLNCVGTLGGPFAEGYREVVFVFWGSIVIPVFLLVEGVCDSPVGD